MTRRATGTNATHFIMIQVGAGVRWNLEYFFVVLSSLVRSMLLMSDDDDSEATMVGGGIRLECRYDVY